ncbi:conjugal transfer protein TrbL family protein [Clostridium estertheticum]|uniref:conjugal transfer protein TrbL family protein n=1 Tax=Clostridium estertheticum TaxID=238834 RepID=UPI001C0D9194|nr:conjugal transfer protein TrbL family protein [Clostridium estertheticum]MBU3173281.1 hypothetical protein [Clostridium estertheticum]
MDKFLSFVTKCITYFFSSFFKDLISSFGTTLANIMGTATSVLTMPLVQNAIHYSQLLAFAILVLKTMSESFETYILYQNGDPDADPSGLLIRTGQAVAVIATLPFIVQQLFEFGSKVSHDVAGLSVGTTGITDFASMLLAVVASNGSVIVLFLIIIIICFLVVAIQSTIRGAELALMAVLGPIMALNITSGNKSVWSAWFKQLIIICTAQSVQIFLLDGAFSFLTNKSITGGGLLLVFGWLWCTIKSPKFIQQFAHSTGFTGAIGGTAKQAGSMFIMKKFMK